MSGNNHIVVIDHSSNKSISEIRKIIEERDQNGTQFIYFKDLAKIKFIKAFIENQFQNMLTFSDMNFENRDKRGCDSLIKNLINEKIYLKLDDKANKPSNGEGIEINYSSLYINKEDSDDTLMLKIIEEIMKIKTFYLENWSRLLKKNLLLDQALEKMAQSGKWDMCVKYAKDFGPQYDEIYTNKREEYKQKNTSKTSTESNNPS